MQFSEREQLQAVNYPKLDEFISIIDDGNDLSAILQNLHQIMLQIIDIINSQQYNFDLISNTETSVFLTNNLPKIIVALIHSSVSIEGLKIIYADLIQIALRFNFHINLLKSLIYPFQYTEKVPKPPRLFPAIINQFNDRAESRKQNTDLHTSATIVHSASKNLDKPNISTTSKVQHPSPQAKKSHHASAPSTPSVHSPHISAWHSASTSLFNLSNFEESYQDILTELAKVLLSTQFFDQVHNFIANNDYSLIQFCNIISLFLYIEPYLPDDDAYKNIIFFYPYIISNLKKIESVSDISEITLFKFILVFSKVLNDSDINLVYSCLIQNLTNLINTHSDDQKIVNECIVETIIKIYHDFGPMESGEVIKRTLLDTIKQITDDFILEKIYKFLPELNVKCPLDAEEIASIYFHVSTLPNIVTESVYALITSPKRDHLDCLALSVLSFPYFSPLLTMYLIDHTNDMQNYLALFYKFIANIEVDTQVFHRGRISLRLLDMIKTELNAIIKYSRMSISSNKNKENVIKMIKDSRSFIVKMGIFLVKMSSAENVTPFINNMLLIREDVPEVETIFTIFIKILSPNELERYYVLVFNPIIEILTVRPLSSNDNHLPVQKKRLASILVKWTLALQSFPDSVMSSLSNLDFSRMNSEIPHIIDTIVQRSTNKKSRRNLALSIACSTVRPRYASWAMRIIQTICNKGRSGSSKDTGSSTNNINNGSGINSGANSNNGSTYLNNSSSFDSVLSPSSSSSLLNSNSNANLTSNSSSNNLIASVEDAHTSNLAKVCDILVRKISEEPKRKNAIHMIMWGCMLECDFYRLKGKSFFSQKVSFEYASKKYDFDLSFHPYHSMRRIYAAISEIIGQPVYLLIVSIADESDTLLKIDDPLSNIIFDVNPNTVINLNVSIKQDVSLFDNFPPWHLNMVPKFLNRLEEIEYINILKEIFRPSTEEGEIVAQILMLIDPYFHTSKQEVFLIDNLSDFFTTFEFADFTRLLPILLHCLAESGTVIPQDFNEKILDALCDYHYGNVGLSIACRAITKLFTNHDFSKRIIKKCLLDTNWTIIRKTFVFLMIDTPIEMIFSFLDFTVRLEYRTKTKQFFELISKMLSKSKGAFDSEKFEPYFLELEPYEVSHYIDADESFIGLISLLKPNDKILDVVFERLFAVPTVKNPHLPFCQTIESRRAAFEYVSKCAMKKNQMDRLNETLLKVPVLSNRPLSDDLSFIGRNLVTGCPNGSSLGCIISLLTNVEPLMAWLFYLDKSQMAPCVVALREFMAAIIFSRDGNVDIKPLLQFPEFLRVLNMPCEIVLNQLFSVVDDLVDSSFGLHSLFEIQIDSKPFNFLSLKVKGYQNMDSSLNDYLKDSQIINKWPDYLLIHLDRLENGKKIINQFEFPLFINKSQYTFIGAVLQCGTKPNGRFLTLSTNYNDWFVTSADRVEYFNQADIPFWCFGANDETLQNQEDFTCASILLYQKSTDRPPMRTPKSYKNIRIPLEIEEKINILNQQIWPSIVLSSPLFVKIALRLNNSEVIFNTLYRICLSDIEFLEKIIPRFKSIITKTQTSQSSFKDFSFKNGFDKITDISIEMSSLLSQLYSKVLNTTEDLKKIIEIFMQKRSEYQYYFFLNVISDDYQKCEIDSELMLVSIRYLTKGRMNAYSNNEISGNNDDYIRCSEIVLSKQISVFNLLMKAVSANMRYQEFSKVAVEIFDVDFLEKWSGVIVKSDTFKQLIQTTNNYYPNIFSSIVSLTPQLGDLFSKCEIKGAASNLSDAIEITDSVWNEVILCNLFSTNKNIRDLILSVAFSVLPKPDKNVELYIQRRIIDDSIKKPKISESAYGFQFTALLPDALEALKVDNDLCDVFLEILESRICYISPIIISSHLDDFFNLLSIATDSLIIEWLLMIIHHILAFDQSKILDPSYVERLLATDFGTTYGIQLLYLLRDRADGSELSGSCFDGCFQSFFDEHSAILLKMIQEGLIIGPTSIDISLTKPKDLMNLQFLNAIYKSQPEYRRTIYLCIKKIINPIKQFLLLGSSDFILESIEILNNFNDAETNQKKYKTRKQINNNLDDFLDDDDIINNDQNQISETEEEVIQYENYCHSKKKNTKVAAIHDFSSNDLNQSTVNNNNSNNKKLETEEKDETKLNNMNSNASGSLRNKNKIIQQKVVANNKKKADANTIIEENKAKNDKKTQKEKLINDNELIRSRRSASLVSSSVANEVN